MALPSLTFKASPNFSSRGGHLVDKLVVHDCEGSWLGSVAWFAQSQSRVSAHLVLSEDGRRAIQMVAWANKAWHVCAYNSDTEGFEAAGYMARGLGAPEWESLASIVAFRLHVRGLPPTWAKDGIGKGFCQHADLGKAGGGHHDITADPKVWEAFVRMVQTEYAKPQPGQWIPSGDVGPLPPPPSNWKPSGTVRHDLTIGSMEWVQMELNVRKYADPVLIVDGIDGPKTHAALIAFQKDHNLTSDGGIGSLTIAALQGK